MGPDSAYCELYVILHNVNYAKSNPAQTKNSQQTKYKSVVSESTHRVLNKTSDLAYYVGAWVPGLGGGDEVTLTFSCEA